MVHDFTGNTYTTTHVVFLLYIYILYFVTYRRQYPLNLPRSMQRRCIYCNGSCTICNGTMPMRSIKSNCAPARPRRRRLIWNPGRRIAYDWSIAMVHQSPDPNWYWIPNRWVVPPKPTRVVVPYNSSNNVNNNNNNSNIIIKINVTTIDIYI